MKMTLYIETYSNGPLI